MTDPGHNSLGLCGRRAVLFAAALPEGSELQDWACREVGKGALITSFSGSQCRLRRGDGAEVVEPISPYPLVLHQLLATHHWDKATKLCHSVKVREQTSTAAMWGQHQLLTVTW